MKHVLCISSRAVGFVSRILSSGFGFRLLSTAALCACAFLGVAQVGCGRKQQEKAVERPFGMTLKNKNVETVVIGHRNPDMDSIAAAIAYAHLKQELGMKHVIAARAGELNARTQFILKKFGFKEPILIRDVSSKQEAAGEQSTNGAEANQLIPMPRRLILVDHNDMMQAVKGAKDVPVTEIIDHHRISTITTQKPILFLNWPVGSTCTIVTKCYQQAGVPISKAMAGLLMSGIISDTLNLTSPTTTDTDREVMKELQKISGQNPSQLAEQMFSVGSPLQTLAPMELVESYAKQFSANGNRFALVHIIEVDHLDLLKQKKQNLLEALGYYRRDHGLLFVALLVTDVNTNNSVMLVAGDEAVLKQIDYPEIEPNMWKLDGVVSFKKQLYPYFAKLLERMKNRD